MRKPIKFISIGILTLSMGVTLVGCGNESNEKESTPTENVDSTSTESEKVNDEEDKETNEELVQKAKDESGLSYILGVNDLVRAIQGEKDLVMSLLDDTHGLPQDQWIKEVNKLGENLEVAIGHVEGVHVPPKYEASNSILQDGIDDLKYFIKTAKEMDTFLATGSTKPQAFVPLSTGINKVTNSMKYREEHESK